VLQLNNMIQNVVVLYFKWHYFERTGFIIKAWRNFLVFNLNYFSISLLIKTLFAPWKKYLWSYGRGFDFGVYFQTFLSNLISRIIGAFIRIIFIIIGIATEILIFVFGLVFIIFWLTLPLLLFLGLAFSFKLLF